MEEKEKTVCITGTKEIEIKVTDEQLAIALFTKIIEKHRVSIEFACRKLTCMSIEAILEICIFYTSKETLYVEFSTYIKDWTKLSDDQADADIINAANQLLYGHRRNSRR